MTVALAMLDAAIRLLDERQDQQSRTRLAFYLLLKAEILRESAEVIGLRARVQEIAPGIFFDFMAVEEATQSLKKAYGMHVGVIADEGIKRRDGAYVRREEGVGWVGYDAALRALHVNELDISEKEWSFLHRATLLQILKHHGIPYAGTP